MQATNNIDPKEKSIDSNEGAEQNTDLNEGVFLYNNDDTPMHTSERTYISVDLPEDEPSRDNTGE